MIAACIVLSHCSIRLGESLSLSVTFLARASVHWSAARWR